MDSNHRRHTPADLQSAPFGHSGIAPLCFRIAKVIGSNLFSKFFCKNFLQKFSQDNFEKFTPQKSVEFAQILAKNHRARIENLFRTIELWGYALPKTFALQVEKVSQK